MRMRPLVIVVLVSVLVCLSGLTCAANDEEDGSDTPPAAQSAEAPATDQASEIDAAQNQRSDPGGAPDVRPDTTPASPSSRAHREDAARIDDGDLSGDESDDAIPTDRTEDPSDAEYEVVGILDADDNGDADNESLPVVRPFAPGSSPTQAAAVPGGKPIPAGATPWQAEIFMPETLLANPPKVNAPVWARKHVCAGALIAADWVLTAAHCLSQKNAMEGYRIRLGAEDISDDDEGKTFKIDRVVRHAAYDPKQEPNYANDIAVVHIVDDAPSRSIDPALIRPILFHGPGLTPDAPVTATVWNEMKMGLGGGEVKAVLMKHNMLAMSTSACQAIPGYGAERIHDGVFCAGNPKRKVCRGDSGGPVVLTNGAPRLVGISSWGKAPCTPGTQPAVYTRVSSYLNWIEQAIR